MSNRIRYTTAAQVAEAFPSVAEMMGEGDVVDDRAPLAFLEACAAAEEPAGGIAFAAFALPKREAIWWGCLGLRSLNLLSGPAIQALEATELWVRTPEEAERRRCGEIAMEQEFGNAGAIIAQGAFCSGGSIGLPEFPAVLPEPDITAKCIFGALLGCIGGDDPLKMDARIRRVVLSAVDFAGGGDGKAAWTGPDPQGPPEPDDEDE